MAEHGRAAAMKLTSRKRQNYGWPLATWGVNYSGLKVPEAKGEIVEERSNRFLLLEAILRRSAGWLFCASDVFAPWRHKPFIGALKIKRSRDARRWQIR
ncbi:PQQ-dependent sugar dehydrogenase [Salmonella enterica subsp. enterica]|nr:PQQ-dependent sugar dehydrogenase [Salmonella enterica subsp. enterica]